MKRRQRIKRITVLACLLVGGGVLAACGGSGNAGLPGGDLSNSSSSSGSSHTHVYERRIETERYVYRAATCQNETLYYLSCTCGQASNDANLVFGDGVFLPCNFTERIEKEEALEGVGDCQNKMTYYLSCSMCGNPSWNDTYTFESDDYGEHNYCWCISEDRYLRTPGSCREEATYYYSCICGAAGEEYFTGGYSHVFDREEVYYTYLKSEATCTEQAEYYKSCSGCGYSSFGEMGDNAPTFKAGGLAPHNYNQQVVQEKYLKEEATCTQGAEYYQSCICGAWSTQAHTFLTMERLPHVYDREVVLDKYLKTAATCLEQAEYYQSCVCTAWSTEAETFRSGDTANHTFSEDWTADETGHWHAATCQCTRIDGKAEHDFGDGDICEVCDYMLPGTAGVVYECDDITAWVVDYTGVDSVVRVSSRYNGLPVQTIGEGAFADCGNVTNIILPKTITTIEREAFYRCGGLTDVVLPESVQTIGGAAFQACERLTSIALPEGLTAIGAAAFQACIGLTTLALPHEMDTLGASAFEDCQNLKEVSFFGSSASYPFLHILPEKVFYNCTSLETVTIPSTVYQVGQDAFYGCQSLTKVAGFVDHWMRIVWANAQANPLAWGADLYDLDNLVTQVSTINETILPYTFYNYKRLTKVELWATSIKSVDKTAFVGCDNLQYTVYENGKYLGNSDNAYVVLIDALNPTVTSVTVHADVCGIAKGALNGCDELVEINLPFLSENKQGSSGTHFGFIFGANDYTENELYVPTSLQTVNVGDSVTLVKAYTFYGCNGLKNVNFTGDLTTFEAYAFYGCSSLQAIVIPKSVTSIREYAFYGCSSLTNLTIPKEYIEAFYKMSDHYLFSVVGEGAFEGCTSIATASIPAEIGPFIPKDNLQTVVLNSGYKIAEEAFARSPKLTSVTIAESIRTLKEEAFYECSQLTDVTFEGENYMTSLPDRVFAGCSLTKISLPSSLTSIGEFAFARCDFTSLYIPPSVTRLGFGLLGGCNQLTRLTVGRIGSAGDFGEITHFGHIFGANSFEENDVCVPKSLTHVSISHAKFITPYSFYQCTGLQQVYINGTAPAVGDYAFYGCSALRSVSLPSSVTQIAITAFDGCTSLVHKPTV